MLRYLECFASKLAFLQHCLQLRHYLVWYSLVFALLHVLLIIFSKMDFNSKLFTYGIIFGIITSILLCIVSYSHFPWISERLLWSEYHFLTSYIGIFCLIVGFFHIFLHWKFNSDSFYLKLISMILLSIVLLLHLTIYGIISPILQFTQCIKTRSIESSSV